MSNFEDTIEDIENRFLANPSLLAGIIIGLENLIEQTYDEINRGRSIALKTLKKTI